MERKLVIDREINGKSDGKRNFTAICLLIGEEFIEIIQNFNIL
jgi:NTP pyrophosphatase (non-canonical NTP hydrolase)